MAHINAMLMLYAAVYGPTTFANRFGDWPSLGAGPSFASTITEQSRVVVTTRIIVPKPLSVPKHGKGNQDAGSKKLGARHERSHCKC